KISDSKLRLRYCHVECARLVRRLGKDVVFLPLADNFLLFRATWQTLPGSIAVKYSPFGLCGSLLVLTPSKMQKKNIEFINMMMLRGPNIWAYRPVIEAWVDIGELEDYPSNVIPGFYERLVQWLPSLIEHRCSVGERGGFLQRLRQGT